MKYVNEFVKFLTVLALVALSACSPSGASVSEDSDPTLPGVPDVVEYAKGMINGRDWTYAQGRAVAFKRNDKQYLEIRLWNESYDNPCAEPVGSTYQVRIYVSFQKGSWKIDPLDPFTLIPTIIFSDYSSAYHSRQNLIADRGGIAISSIQSDSITGVVHGGFSNASPSRSTHVLGRFSVPLCTPLFGSY